VDPSRKRKIRLVVALSAAVLLAAGLVYTSFSASTEAKEPSQLLQSDPGRTYQLTGEVVPGSIHHAGDQLDFQVSDRDGSHPIPVAYSGTVPDPFPRRARGDRHRQARERHLHGGAGQPDHEVPVEVHDHDSGAVQLTVLGSALLAAALLCALYAVGAGVYGGRTGDRRWIDSARRAVYAMAGLLTTAVVLIELAFLRNDFHFALVADHSSTTTPTFYKLTAMWSSQEGSLLLWAWVLSLASSGVLYITRRRHREIVPWATAILAGLGSFFIGLMIWRPSRSPISIRHRRRGRG